MKIIDSEVNKICMICWGLLGDVFIRVPLVEAVKKRFPHAEITVVVDTKTAPVMQGNPAVSEIFVYDKKKKPYLKYLQHSAHSLYLLRKRKFDLTINLYSGGSSAFVTWIMNAKYRLSYNHLCRLRAVSNILVEPPSYCKHWIKEHGVMLGPLGISVDDIRIGTSFYCSENALNQAASTLDKKYKYISINLGASSENKRWPVDNFVATAKYIYDKYGFLPIVFTNPGMEHLASEFEEKYQKYSKIFVIPVVGIDLVAAYMMKSEYVLTGDTSLMHLAFGVQRPTLVLFTYTRPEWHVVEDCCNVVCFVEDDQVGRCDLRVGKRDIPVDYVEEQFDKLVSKCG